MITSYFCLNMTYPRFLQTGGRGHRLNAKTETLNQIIFTSIFWLFTTPSLQIEARATHCFITSVWWIVSFTERRWPRVQLLTPSANLHALGEFWHVSMTPDSDKALLGVQSGDIFCTAMYKRQLINFESIPLPSIASLRMQPNVVVAGLGQNSLQTKAHWRLSVSLWKPHLTENLYPYSFECPKLGSFWPWIIFTARKKYRLTDFVNTGCKVIQSLSSRLPCLPNV